MSQTTLNPRSAARTHTHHAPSPELATLFASEELDRLEDRGDALTLGLLADAYSRLAEQLGSYAALRDAAARLRESTRTYDVLIRESAPLEQLDLLQASGLAVFRPDDRDLSPSDLRAEAGHAKRLARIAGEAAAGLKNHQQIGELIGIGVGTP